MENVVGGLLNVSRDRIKLNPAHSIRMISPRTFQTHFNKKPTNKSKKIVFCVYRLFGIRFLVVPIQSIWGGVGWGLGG